MDQIYLDNNATTRIDPLVVQAMQDCYAQRLANPSSQHQLGQQARRILEATRERIGQILGCRLSSVDADRIIFTSGGTESNNLAILGLAGKPPGRILISAIEHPSVMGPAQQLANLGFDVRRIPVLPTGVVNLDTFAEMLDDDVRLVSVMMANNETGAIQPIQELAALCKHKSTLIHTDAVQVPGKLPLHFAELDLDGLSISAHKLHGPKGFGVLIVRHEPRLEPVMYGGFQQSGLRPGTESVALSVGMLKALESWISESTARSDRMRSLRDRLERDLLSADLGAVINCCEVERLPHTSNISFPGLDRQVLLLALDMAGIACSTGSACASGSSEQSPVLLAMGLPPAVIEGSLRFSLGADTSEAEIVESVRRISRVVKDLRRSK